MRDWLITARKLITQKSPNTKLYIKTILYICTYIDQLAVNNCQLYISNHSFLAILAITYKCDNVLRVKQTVLRVKHLTLRVKRFALIGFTRETMY